RVPVPKCSGASSSTTPAARWGWRAAQIAARVPPRECPTRGTRRGPGPFGHGMQAVAEQTVGVVVEAELLLVGPGVGPFDEVGVQAVAKAAGDDAAPGVEV